MTSDKPGNSAVEVEPGSPISLCEEFNAKYVTSFVSKGVPRHNQLSVLLVPIPTFGSLICLFQTMRYAMLMPYCL